MLSPSTRRLYPVVITDDDGDGVADAPMDVGIGELTVPEGWDGLHLIAEPFGLRWAVGKNKNQAIVVHHEAKHVRLEGFAIEHGKNRSVSANPKGNGHDYQPLKVEFVECYWGPPTDPSWTPKWTVMGYQADLHFLRCVADGTITIEHFAYVHGAAYEGGNAIYINGCLIRGLGGQIAKVVGRPDTESWGEVPDCIPGGELSTALGTPYVPNSRLEIRDSFLFGFGAPVPGGYPIGGGVVVEGGGLQSMLIENTVIQQGPIGHGVTVGVDAVLYSCDKGRFYNVDTGIPGIRPGNGELTIRNSFLIADGPGNAPNFRYTDGRGVTIENTQIYGGSKMSFHYPGNKSKPSGKVTMLNNNTMVGYIFVKALCSLAGTGSPRTAPGLLAGWQFLPSQGQQDMDTQEKLTIAAIAAVLAFAIAVGIAVVAKVVTDVPYHQDAHNCMETCQ